jgi:arylsulfatase A-like enzyme
VEHPDITSLVRNQFGGTLSWHASPRSDRDHTDALMAKDADWVLERCARDDSRPFFLSVGFFRPHTPYVAPKTPWYDMYDVNAMPVVGNIETDRADIPEPGLGSRKPEQERMTDEQRRQARQAYSACISFMDHQVGVVLDSLERHGLADNTVVVFTSDHGYHMGEHGLWQKMSLFEESARVPLLIAMPDGQGAVVRTPVSHVDLFPTLAELCGLRAPEGLQGQSLVPMLKDPQQAGRGWALTQVTRGGGGNQKKNADANPRFFGYSLRTTRWRYTEWDEGRKGRELYDHETDPLEQTNLADSDAHQQVIAELSGEMHSALPGTLPPDGRIPEVQPRLWAPLLVDP